MSSKSQATLAAQAKAKGYKLVREGRTKTGKTKLSECEKGYRRWISPTNNPKRR